MLDQPPPLNDSHPKPPLWIVAMVVAIAIGLVYSRGLNAPFVFDDYDTIVRNTSVHSLWPLIGREGHRGPLNPPRDLPTSARPLVNYAFALNWHFNGDNPWWYHAVNAAIHFLSALLLFAIIRRVLRLPVFAGRFDAAAGWIAFATTLLWALHPLHTEAIIYTTQRTELMMAFFYLATIYTSLRYWAADEPGRLHPHVSKLRAVWLALAILACLCGMLSKEVMVSAPLIILLIERTFVTRSLAKALRNSWPLYLGLALTWIPLVALSLDAPRSFSSGFHLGANKIIWWFTQCKVLLMYLKLTIWPWPLRCAYELPHVETPLAILLFVTPVILLGTLALWLVKRNHPVGFVLVFVAAILAPTSLLPIMTEMAAERRMYLPLAALIAFAIVAIYLFAKRQHRLSVLAGESSDDSKAPRNAALFAVLVIGFLYGLLGYLRLGEYYNEMDMWLQVAQSEPKNHIAHYNLGLMYNEQGREADSLAELQAAVAANPNYIQALSALGFALMNAGRMDEAVESIKAALAIDPRFVPALNNLGIALIRMGHSAEAIESLQRAVQLDPTHADSHHNLGKALFNTGRRDQAIEQLQIAHNLAPNDAEYLKVLNEARGNK